MNTDLTIYDKKEHYFYYLKVLTLGAIYKIHWYLYVQCELTNKAGRNI